MGGGALLALAACPGPVTGGLAGAAGLSLVVAGALAGLRADGTECAGMVAVVALWLYDLAPASVAWLVSRADRRKVAGPVDAQVRQAQALLTGRLPTMQDIVDGCVFLLGNPSANGVNLDLNGGLA